MGANADFSATYTTSLIPSDFALQPTLQPDLTTAILQGSAGASLPPRPATATTQSGVVAITAVNSTDHTATVKPARPQKPRPDFPLGPHPAGYWCKKIRGQIHYFGPRWHDAVGAAAATDAALAEYLEKKD